MRLECWAKMEMRLIECCLLFRAAVCSLALVALFIIKVARWEVSGSPIQPRPSHLPRRPVLRCLLLPLLVGLIESFVFRGTPEVWQGNEIPYLFLEQLIELGSMSP